MFFFPIGTKEVAKEESTLICRPTSHTCCLILLSSSLTCKRCSSCNLHCHTLRSLVCRIENSEHNVDRSDPCSHVNYRFLSTPEKTERLQRMHSELCRTELQKNRLKLKLNEAVEKDGVVVDPVTHADLQSIMSSHEKNIVETYPEDSFQHIFWKQQQKAAKLWNARHVSGWAYEMIAVMTSHWPMMTVHPYWSEVWMTILESGWNLWVWLVGVVSRRWVWLVGESMGMVTMYMCG